MKNIFRILISGLLLLSGAVLGGCSDDPDAINDPVLDRALMPLNFKGAVLATGNQVRFNWDVRSTVAEYEVVVYSDAEMTAVVTSKSGILAEEVPLTLDLEAEKSYYATVQAFSSNKRVLPSKLASCGPLATYAIMDPLNPEVTGRTSASITLKWDKDQYVSHILAAPVSDESASEVKHELTAGEIDAATATVDGLKPSTEYLVSIFYNSASRGGQAVWTRPDTEGTTEVSSSADLLKAIEEGATKILLKYSDTPYDVTPPAEPAGQSNALSELSTDLAIYGETADNGAKPVVVGFGPSFVPGTAAYSLHLEDLVLDGGGSEGSVVTLSANTAMEAIFIKNCEIRAYTKGVVAETISDKSVSVGSMTLDGLYVHDIEGNGGDVVDFRFGTYGDVTLINSTFYNGGRGFVFMQGGTIDGTVVIRNNTVSRFGLATNRKGLICLRAANLTTDKFRVEKNVILNQYVESATGYTFISNYSDAILPTMSANYFYNYYEKLKDDSDPSKGGEGFMFASNIGLTPELCLADGGRKLEADPCENSAKGKLYLTDGQIAAAGVGDPRWWNAVAPVVPEQTELLPLSEAWVYDFSNTDYFEAQEITRNLILSNIRFLVSDAQTPMSVTENGTASFVAATTFSRTGEPENQALAFEVTSPGTVIVTAEDAGYDKHIEVIVAGVRRTLQADGTAQKASYPDIAAPTTVYITACDAVEIQRVEWSLDLVIEGPFALDTPEPEAALEEVETKGGKDQTITWSDIDNAVAYEVTFNGKTSKVQQPEFVIASSQIALLEEGDYEVQVVAQPETSSLNFIPSLAGTVKFHVVKSPDNVNVYKWDFTDALIYPGGDVTAETVYGSKPGDRDLTFHATVDKKITIEASKRVKMNGSASLDGNGVPDRGFSFVAENKGTLKITHRSSSSTGTGRFTVVSVDGVEKGRIESPLSAADAEEKGPAVYVLDQIVSGQTVYIYCPTGAVNYYDITWEEEKSQSSGGETVTTTLTKLAIKEANPSLPSGSSAVTGPVTWSFDGVDYESVMAAGKTSGIDVLYFYGSAKTAGGVNYLKTTSSVGEIVKITFVMHAWKAATKFTMSEMVGGVAQTVTPTSDQTTLTHVFEFSEGNDGTFEFRGGSDDLKILSFEIVYKK